MQQTIARMHGYSITSSARESSVGVVKVKAADAQKVRCVFDV
jgi:hypothetical protein